MKQSTAPSTAKTSGGTIVSPAPALTTSAFGKIMNVLEALEPLIIAGVSPFIKNPETGQIIASEAPVVQALLQALSAL